MKTCKRGHQHLAPSGGCPECRRARNREWMRSWRVTNPDEARAHDRRQAATPERKEQSRLRAQAWRDANPEASRAKSRLNKAKHPQRCLEAQARRRARKRGLTSEPVTAAHLAILFEGQDGRCRYCRCPLGQEKHLDHRTPLSRGGAHSPSNVCWACPSCNQKKSSRTEREFLALLEAA